MIVSSLSTTVPDTVTDTVEVNGKFTEVTVPNSKGLFRTVTRDYAVNLNNGAVSTLATMPSEEDESWYDGDLTDLVK